MLGVAWRHVTEVDMATAQSPWQRCDLPLAFTNVTSVRQEIGQLRLVEFQLQLSTCSICVQLKRMQFTHSHTRAYKATNQSSTKQLCERCAILAKHCLTYLRHIGVKLTHKSGDESHSVIRQQRLVVRLTPCRCSLHLHVFNN